MKMIILACLSAIALTDSASAQEQASGPAESPPDPFAVPECQSWGDQVVGKPGT